jgi:SEL1 protein
VRHGSPFEAFHLLAKIYATTARLPSHAGGERGNCGVSVAYFKIVSERGSWQDDFVGEGDRAWARGEEDVALVRWLVAAEMGSEIGQNNVAFLLEGGRGEQLFPGSTKSLAMRHWVRSAAQDNVDAMVKVGDLYCESGWNRRHVRHCSR